MAKKMIQEAYAAYNNHHEWIPLSSIKNDPEAVETWINKTYVSGRAREQFRIIRIEMGEVR